MTTSVLGVTPSPISGRFVEDKRFKARMRNTYNKIMTIAKGGVYAPAMRFEITEVSGITSRGKQVNLTLEGKLVKLLKDDPSKKGTLVYDTVDQTNKVVYFSFKSADTRLSFYEFGIASTGMETNYECNLSDALKGVGENELNSAVALVGHMNKYVELLDTKGQSIRNINPNMKGIKTIAPEAGVKSKCVLPPVPEAEKPSDANRNVELKVEARAQRTADALKLFTEEPSEDVLGLKLAAVTDLDKLKVELDKRSKTRNSCLQTPSK